MTIAPAVGCRREEASKGPGAAEEVAVPKGEGKVGESGKPLSGRDVLKRMADAYHKASTYADAGEVHLVAEADGEKVIDKKADFSVSFQRANKIRLQAYRTMVVCDGEKFYGSLGNHPNEVLVRPAPPRLTLKTLFADQTLAMGLMTGFAGGLPQVMLLLADDPLKVMLADTDEPTLSESGQIEGRDCYRVKISRAQDGMATFWIDKQTFVLRRIMMPTDGIRQDISRERPVDRVSLVAEFTGAKFDDKIDPKAFAFEVPEGAKIVKFFVPSELAYMDWLGKKAPELKFFDLDGKPVTSTSLAGKIVVFEFWASWCGPCRRSLPNMEKVYERFKGNPKVAFYAVSVDEPNAQDKELVKAFADMKIHIPILRDPEKSGAALRFTGIPTVFVLGSDGVVQDCKAGAGQNLSEELPAKIEKLLAGQNVFEAPLKEFQSQLEQYGKALDELYASDSAPSESSKPTDTKTADTKTAERSDPKTMKLVPLWKCADLKAPGNILVLGGKNQPTRLAVIEGWKSVAEVGLDGKRIAMHSLDLEESEVIGSLREAAGADGKRYIVAFMTTHQRCHVLDENWKVVARYPEDALKNPHSGIVDVELADLNGDGKLELCVSYLGVVGVQGASLEGKNLWRNRSISNAGGMLSGPGEKGRSLVYCTNGTDTIAVLDGEGQRKGEITVPNCLLHWIVAADLRGDGKPLWCGMAAPKVGENVAVGISPKGERLWSYQLPPGIPSPMEPIVAGKLTREGPGQWILPGSDGSVHILLADGKPLDKFNSGAMLQGMATVEIDGRPALLISSPNGLQAWKVE
jgi:thiol-disulfide isomerase/thioredoxin